MLGTPSFGRCRRWDFEPVNGTGFLKESLTPRNFAPCSASQALAKQCASSGERSNRFSLTATS